MRQRRNGYLHECVLLDLNTQRDFLGENAPCRVANASELVPALRNIIAWTLRNEVPIISSMESRRSEEATLGSLPPHCLDGTAGQLKLRFTLLRNRVSVEGDNTLTLPLDLFQNYQQVIFRKRTDDLLSNPKADRFLTQLRAREYIVFGLGLEHSVKSLALALRARSQRISVITDGCGYWSASTAEFALRQMVAKGIRLITVEELLRRKLGRPRRYSRLINGNSHRPGNSGVYPALPPAKRPDRNGRSSSGVRSKTNGRTQRPPAS